MHTQHLGVLDNKITILTYNILLGTISVDPGAPHNDNQQFFHGHSIQLGRKLSMYSISAFD